MNSSPSTGMSGSEPDSPVVTARFVWGRAPSGGWVWCETAFRSISEPDAARWPIRSMNRLRKRIGRQSLHEAVRFPGQSGAGVVLGDVERSVPETNLPGTITGGTLQTQAVLDRRREWRPRTQDAEKQSGDKRHYLTVISEQA